MTEINVAIAKIFDLGYTSITVEHYDPTGGYRVQALGKPSGPTEVDGAFADGYTMEEAFTSLLEILNIDVS
ncbi:MAG: hypothetical protein GF350_16825 [Chitinivibrionales bacterium]|nr:hypothetical protein [Chitinivibrionales bacterium]